MLNVVSQVLLFSFQNSFFQIPVRKAYSYIPVGKIAEKAVCIFDNMAL